MESVRSASLIDEIKTDIEDITIIDTLNYLRGDAMKYPQYAIDLKANPIQDEVPEIDSDVYIDSSSNSENK